LVTARKHVNNIRAIARQPPIKIIEELLEVVFSVTSALRLYNEDPRPATQAAVNWVTKTIRRIARKKALERWETKIENCEVTPQAIWSIEAKASTAIHGPSGPVFYPNEKPM
jgi:hypothetical protein